MKEEKKQDNLYAEFSARDSACLKKIDAKLANLQKQNKQSVIGFYEVAKNFVLNAIEVAKNHKVGNYQSLPKRLLTFIEERDIDALYQTYMKDTKALASNLFDAEMSLEEICAIAMEYVRVSSSSFARYDSESLRNEQSELAEQFSIAFNGVLSFYVGVASEVDRGQLLARLINCGIDIKKKISYSETIVDVYGNPVTQIVEFKRKPALSVADYNGVVKTYIKTIKKSSKFYQFLDFSQHVTNARKKVVEVFKRFHALNVFNNIADFGDSIEELAQTCFKNMSDVTASEQNLFVECGDRIVKFSTIIEIALMDRNFDYEPISDLFEERLASLKVIAEELGNAKVKVFPNKVLDENYQLNARKSYLLYKGAKSRDQSFEENAQNGESFEEKLRHFDEELAMASTYEPINLDDVKPVPAKDVLDNLKVKFCAPSEENSFEMDGVRFNFSDDPAMNALGIAKNIDLDEAERERLLFEQETGIKLDEPAKAIESKPKRKSFMDAMEEIADKIKTTRAKKLQDKFEEYEKNGELNSQNECGNVEKQNLKAEPKKAKKQQTKEKAQPKAKQEDFENVEELEQVEKEEKFDSIEKTQKVEQKILDKEQPQLSEEELDKKLKQLENDYASSLQTFEVEKQKTKVEKPTKTKTGASKDGKEKLQSTKATTQKAKNDNIAKNASKTAKNDSIPARNSGLPAKNASSEAKTNNMKTSKATPKKATPKMPKLPPKAQSGKPKVGQKTQMPKLPAKPKMPKLPKAKPNQG